MRFIDTILCSTFLAGAAVSAQAPSVQRDLVLGCEACGGAAQFSSIFDVAVSASGDIVVADRDAPVLRRFDAAGKPAWSGGAKGRGPGEYQLVLRAAFLPNGGVVTVDMTAQRVTALAPDGRVTSTAVLPRFATTASADFAGNVIVGAEGPRGTLDLFRWRAGVVTPVTLALGSGSSAETAPRNSSVALSPAGVIAAFVNTDHYVIVRVDSAGKRLPDLRRAVERVRRTNEEEAELRGRLARSSEMVAAEARTRGGSGARPVPVFPESERSLKPHATVDAMRYDPQGRLWVRTMRGDRTNTVFDVFAANGTFAGTVTVPVAVQSFALGGTYLVTAGENADGIPQVIRWIVR